MKINKSRGFSHIELVIVIVIIGVICLVGWHVYYDNHKVSSTSTISSGSSSQGSSSGSLLPPTVPTNNAYLGAWVNPDKATGVDGNTGAPGSNEIAQLPAFKSSIGKSVAILHVWTGFNTAVPVSTLDAISQNGSIPLIDWGCSSVTAISSGSDDSTINSYADALKSYGKPVFLRWYWEMNQMNGEGGQPAGSNCGGYNNGPAFIAAWQHIYNLFKADGASNVAFVWCPGYSGGNFSEYYPGNNYVDWIGVDRYERTTNNQPLLSFSDMFSQYYNQWLGNNKPIMVAETAAMGGANQLQYLSSIKAEAPQFPDIKAVVYFDSVGPAGNWSLQGNGFSGFQDLAESQYFSATDN